MQTRKEVFKSKTARNQSLKGQMFLQKLNQSKAMSKRNSYNTKKNSEKDSEQVMAWVSNNLNKIL